MNRDQDAAAGMELAGPAIHGAADAVGEDVMETRLMLMLNEAGGLDR